MEKLTVGSSTYKLNEASIKRPELERLTHTHKNTLWGEEDKTVDLQLTNVGVDVQAIINKSRISI
jgi:hypothetical protein